MSVSGFILVKGDRCEILFVSGLFDSLIEKLHLYLEKRPASQTSADCVIDTLQTAEIRLNGTKGRGKGKTTSGKKSNKCFPCCAMGKNVIKFEFVCVFPTATSRGFYAILGNI